MVVSKVVYLFQWNVSLILLIKSHQLDCSYCHMCGRHVVLIRGWRAGSYHRLAPSIKSEMGPPSRAQFVSSVGSDDTSTPYMSHACPLSLTPKRKVFDFREFQTLMQNPTKSKTAWHHVFLCRKCGKNSVRQKKARYKKKYKIGWEF